MSSAHRVLHVNTKSLVLLDVAILIIECFIGGSALYTQLRLVPLRNTHVQTYAKQTLAMTV